MVSQQRSSLGQAVRVSNEIIRYFPVPAPYGAVAVGTAVRRTPTGLRKARKPAKLDLILGRRNPNMGLDETASRKKAYGKLKLNRLDPQEALAKIKRAAEARKQERKDHARPH
jgi:hypothetical protein